MQGFKPADRDIIESVIRRLEGFKETYAEYKAMEKNKSGNKLEQGELEKGAFEIWLPAVFAYRLKPSHDFVKIEI